MMDLCFCIMGIVPIIIVLWCYGTYIGSHFSRHGIKTLPLWPVYGNMTSVFFQQEHFKDLAQRIYNAHPNERYVGVYQFYKRMILIRNVDLIKQLTMTDFKHFTDHIETIDSDIDSIFGKNLYTLNGQKWCDMRSTLSSTYTDAKMENMFELVSECGDKMKQFYLKEMGKSKNIENGFIEVEMEDAFSRYTSDLIATVAFGFTIDSHTVRDNYFYKMTKGAAYLTGIGLMKYFLFTLSPRLTRNLGIKMFSDSLHDFYRDLIYNAIKTREETKIFRPDMIHLLVEAKRESLSRESHRMDTEKAEYDIEESSIGKSIVKRYWNDEYLIAQAITFFLSGFETISNVLSFLIYELSINPEIQKRLQEEIDQVLLENDGNLNYNALQSMKYMDMVVSETLRLWSPTIVTDRKCIKPYNLPPPNDFSDKKAYQINVGDGIFIPIWGIHHDPEYYPNPSKFDPERFSNDNKGNIQPATYLPFGIGPRNCIASRFAIMATKAVTFHLLWKFHFFVVSKTQIPAKLAKNTFHIHSEKGIWSGLRLRSQK